MNFSVYTQPSNEPVTLAEAKEYMRVEVDDDDALIAALITAARRQAEEYTRRAFVTQVLDVWYDRDELFEHGEFVELPRPPVASITSIESYDSEDVETTMPAASYRLSSSVEGRIVLTGAGEWPSDLREHDCLTVRYTAGYGTPADVPEDIKTAIKAMVLAAYEGRCDVTIDAGRAFLDPYRVYAL